MSDIFSKKVSPMLATLGSMPKTPKNYAYEFKWDGYRALCFWNHKNISFQTRNGIDITLECGSLFAQAPRLGKWPLILDGEIIVADSKGNSDFSLLQEHFGFRRKIKRHFVQLSYIVFDLLYLKDQWTTSLPFQHRRSLLEKFSFGNLHWSLSPCVFGQGKKMCLQAESRGMEGIIAKRLESIYQIGRRSTDWIKIKFIAEQALVS